MPYQAPHTAGPALWALRHSTNCAFEVSVVPVEGSTPWRKGLEALAIGLYRQAHGRSPNVNFGRVPSGYRMSSDNNAKLQLAGRVFRGGLSEESQPHHQPGVPPARPLVSEPTGMTWCGHSWSLWMPIGDAQKWVMADAVGLYPIRAATQPVLLYIGEGMIRSRLKAHQLKMSVADHAQGQLFRAARTLECSWVINNGWLDRQRLELENDLMPRICLSPRPSWRRSFSVSSHDAAAPQQFGLC